jgi:tRNA A37 N6-isopentenylltransferase MiaA
MSKIGVGVGEDFPVDENDKSGPEVEDLGNCHSRHRARRQAWHQFRRQMREEWHARRQAMRDALNDREAVEAIHDFRTRHLHHVLIGGLAVVGLAALFGALRSRD